mgnify:CR=1 FL=1
MGLVADQQNGRIRGPEKAFQMMADAAGLVSDKNALAAAAVRRAGARGRRRHHNIGSIGLVLVLLLWIKDNFPSRHDVIWLLKGGGMFAKGVHPPSWKFNAGQKIVFWVTILGGLSLSLSGWTLLDPFTTTMFADTFALLNVVGFSLPTDLSPMQEQQYAQLWHAAVSMVMIAIILAHIYIGSLGMEGAFDAMGSGQVDLNWAKEHHSLWVDEVQEKEQHSGRTAPAE